MLADSEADALAMENHASRPEVQAALQGGIGESLRFSDTQAMLTLYAAMRISPALILRLSYPLWEIAGMLAMYGVGLLCLFLVLYILPVSYTHLDVYKRQLYTRRRQMAWSLSEGEQQILAIGRALMGRPKLLILDEPSHGLAPKMIETMFCQLTKLNNEEGISMLIAEQNARLSLEVADYAYVLQRGKLLMENAARELKHDKRIIYAYLHN